MAISLSRKPVFGILLTVLGGVIYLVFHFWEPSHSSLSALLLVLLLFIIELTAHSLAALLLVQAAFEVTSDRLWLRLAVGLGLFLLALANAVPVVVFLGAMFF